MFLLHFGLIFKGNDKTTKLIKTFLSISDKDSIPYIKVTASPTRWIP